MQIVGLQGLKPTTNLKPQERFFFYLWKFPNKKKVQPIKKRKESDAEINNQATMTIGLNNIILFNNNELKRWSQTKEWQNSA